VELVPLLEGVMPPVAKEASLPAWREAIISGDDD
jgi:hypothetical protein